MRKVILINPDRSLYQLLFPEHVQISVQHENDACSLVIGSSSRISLRLNASPLSWREQGDSLVTLADLNIELTPELQSTLRQFGEFELLEPIRD